MSSELQKPFPESDIKWRVQSSGLTKNGKPWAQVLAYVDARAIMDRLDSFLGPNNWKNDVTFHGDNALTSLSVKIGDEWVSKIDGSPETAVEGFKGSISKSLVRAAVLWGIGRYLYKLPINFADCSLEFKEGWNRSSSKDKKTNKFFTFYWRTPTLPAWALPPKEEKEETEKKPLESAYEINDAVMHIKELLTDLSEFRELDTDGKKELLFNATDTRRFNDLYDFSSQRLDEIIDFLERELNEG